MRFKHVLALLGFAVMAAAYSEVGIYERFYFYYAYKLDSMIVGQPLIAAGCKNCNFNEFINFIEGNEGNKIRKVSAEHFPDVEKTAKLYEASGAATQVREGRVYNGAKDYGELFELVRKRLEFLQWEGSYEYPGLTGEKLATQVAEVKTNIMHSMKQVWQGRVRAALTSFKPYEGFKIIPTADGKSVDIAATLEVEENKGAMTKAKLEELWGEHTKTYKGADMVKEFKPLKDWHPAIVETEGIISMKSSLQGAAKSGWLTNANWLVKKWRNSYDLGHSRNVDSVGDTYKALEPQLCPNTASRRDFGILRKRQAFCIRAAKIKETMDVEPKGLDTEVKPGEGKLGQKHIPASEGQVKRANSVSENAFEKSTEKRLGKVPSSFEKKYGTSSFKTLRTKALGYKPLEPNSPKLRSGGTGLGKVGKALGAVGAVLYVKDIVDAFRDNVSPLHFFATITSIVPFLGCATDAAASAEDKAPVGFIVAEGVLCNVADALLLTPFWPVGVAVHIVRAVVKLFRAPPTPPTVLELVEKRDAAWAQALEDIYRYMYSAYEMNSKSSFAFKTGNALFFDSLNVLSESADTVGSLNATGSAELFDPNLFPDQNAVPDAAELETGSKEAIEKLQEEEWEAVLRRQRHTLLRTAIATANGSLFELDKAAVDVNTKFINYIESKEFKDIYPNNGWQGAKILAFFKNWATAMSKYPGLVPGVPSAQLFAPPVGDDPDFEYPDIYTFIEKRVQETSDYVRSKPPVLPRALDVAYILGQSKALLNIPNDTLSPMSFLKVEVSQVSEKPLSSLYLQTLVVRHTREIVEIMYGRVKEEKLKDSDFAVENPELLNKFRLLIAMKLGAVHDADRVAEIKRRHPSGYAPELLNHRGLVRSITPYIPVFQEDPTDPVPVSYYLSMVSGLEKTLVDEALHTKVAKYVETQDEAMKNYWEQQKKHFNSLKGIVDKIASVRSRAPPTPSEFLAKYQPVCVGKGQDDKTCQYLVEACYFGESIGDEFVNLCMDDALSLEKTRANKAELCAKFPSYKSCELAIQDCDNTYRNSMYTVLFECAAKAAPDREAEYAKMAAE
ncbi:heat-labile enterotoxin, A chain [Pochonia chlamydosporia 170]|uniref:Heat-labile enterotoxin, A chain n=1 Tax=Pochonia chlamydosporia 170 TaxID=1380566 RepID=A0A179F4B7_METCM|nr:heat-labile enterotoxin, A chain [Pochonia chlamydosporia 170]OAQ60268.1 heat-labile enterotoxin, A chain [Pochonia chlamydosporia 170]